MRRLLRGAEGSIANSFKHKLKSIHFISTICYRKHEVCFS